MQLTFKHWKKVEGSDSNRCLVSMKTFEDLHYQYLSVLIIHSTGGNHNSKVSKDLYLSFA